MDPVMDTARSNLENAIERAGCIARKNHGDSIAFYFNGKRFPAVSVTGSSCALDCKHCKRKMIRRLPPALTPRELVELCNRFCDQGARGVLLTGGCTADARVPLQPFLGALSEIKEKTDLKVLAHTGLLDYSEAKALGEAGLDGVSIDVVGSPDTTKEIYGIEIDSSEYRKTLKALQRAKIGNISPHVCIGLHYGRLYHEREALEIISSITPSNIVLIGLTDLIGTPLEGVKIDPMDYASIVCEARMRFPGTRITAGCARGKGKARAVIDRLSVRAGVNGIAIPTRAAYEESEKLGLQVTEYDSCCAFIPEELDNRK